MSQVPVASYGWGVVQDTDGNVQPGVAYTLTLLDNTPVASGSTNSRGEIPGSVSTGVYKLTVLGRTQIVHAVEADAMPTPAQVARIPSQTLADALAGTNGTPGSANRFLSETDARIAPRQIGATTATMVREAAVTGDTQPRWQQLANGAVLWGPGAATAPDTRFERAGAGRLKLGLVGSTQPEIARFGSGLLSARPAQSADLEGMLWWSTDGLGVGATTYLGANVPGVLFQVQGGVWTIVSPVVSPWFRASGAGAAWGFAGSYTHYDTTTYGPVEYRKNNDTVEFRGSMKRTTGVPVNGEGCFQVQAPTSPISLYAPWSGPIVYNAVTGAEAAFVGWFYNVSLSGVTSFGSSGTGTISNMLVMDHLRIPTSPKTTS